MVIVKLYDKKTLKEKLTYHFYPNQTNETIKCFDKYIICYSDREIYYIDYENDYYNGIINEYCNTFGYNDNIILVKVVNNLLYVFFENNIVERCNLMKYEIMNFLTLYEYKEQNHILYIDHKYIYLCNKEIFGTKINSIKYPLVLFNYNMENLENISFKFI